MGPALTSPVVEVTPAGVQTTVAASEAEAEHLFGRGPRWRVVGIEHDVEVGACKRTVVQLLDKAELADVHTDPAAPTAAGW